MHECFIYTTLFHPPGEELHGLTWGCFRVCFFSPQWEGSDVLQQQEMSCPSCMQACCGWTGGFVVSSYVVMKNRVCKHETGFLRLHQPKERQVLGLPCLIRRKKKNTSLWLQQLQKSYYVFRKIAWCTFFVFFLSWLKARFECWKIQQLFAW